MEYHRKRHYDRCEDECQSLHVKNLDVFCDLRFEHEFGHSSKIKFQKTCHLDAEEACIHTAQVEIEKVNHLTAGELVVTGPSYLIGVVEADKTLLVRGASTLRGDATVGTSTVPAELAVFGSATVTGPVVGQGFLNSASIRTAAGSFTENLEVSSIPIYNYNSIQLELRVKTATQTSLRVVFPLPTNDPRLLGVVGSTSRLQVSPLFNTYLPVSQNSAKVNNTLEADFVVLGNTPPSVGSTFTFTAFLVWEQPP